MILGQDFDCEKNFNIALKQGSEDINRNPTWRNIRKILHECGISENDCFFTNAILGARKGDKGTGRSPAFTDPSFIDYCRQFFLLQISLQKPTLILILGKYTAQFLYPLNSALEPLKSMKNFEELDNNHLQVIKNIGFLDKILTNIVILIHPSLRHLNIGRRKYLGYSGHLAEIEMIKEGLKL
jgi:uracil-DNA glycosylase family 4